MTQPFSTPSPYLTVREVAHQINTPLSTTYDLLRSGEIASVRIGRRGVRVPAVELAAYLEQRTKGGAR